MTIRTRCRQRVHLIQHAFIRSRASSRGYTFEVRLFGLEQVLSGSRRSRHVRRGSSCTHVVVEVVVLSFICDHRDGSRNRGTRHLVENHGGGSCTHVVVELDGTNVLEGSRGTRRVPKPKWYLAISGTVLTFRCGVVVHVNGHRGTSFRSCSRTRHRWTFEGLAYPKGYLAIDGRRGT